MWERNKGLISGHYKGCRMMENWAKGTKEGHVPNGVEESLRRAQWCRVLERTSMPCSCRKQKASPASFVMGRAG